MVVFKDERKHVVSKEGFEHKTKQVKEKVLNNPK
jgi:hypothetical protein